LAILFVVISASFYDTLGDAFPELDVESAEVRAELQPLNPPPDDSPPQLETATDVASTDAFHLAMLVTMVLLLGGALVNAIGLERRPESGQDAADEPERGDQEPTGVEANEEVSDPEPATDHGIT
jgi:hypothetical protein